MCIRDSYNTLKTYLTGRPDILFYVKELGSTFNNSPPNVVTKKKNRGYLLVDFYIGNTINVAYCVASGRLLCLWSVSYTHLTIE